MNSLAYSIQHSITIYNIAIYNTTESYHTKHINILILTIISDFLSYPMMTHYYSQSLLLSQLQSQLQSQSYT